MASFSYDAFGRRIAKTVDGETTDYLYDGIDAVQETHGGTVNPILTGLRVDERFARNEGSVRSYFLADALGSTVALTDAGESLVQQYQYDPYGNTTAMTGTTNPYQYTGRENDGTGLYYYRARYYSPAIGRFISKDPMGFGGGQGNFYAYVGGGPLSYTDPLGLWAPPALPPWLANFATGMADAASLGIGPLARDAFGIDGGIDQCSTAYEVGGWASLGFGAGRMLYAGAAKVDAMAAADGAGAMAFRNGLKRVMRGPLAGSSFRIKDYTSLLNKYGTDDAIKAAAGRTNTLANAAGADMTIGRIVNSPNCGCR